MQNKFLYFPGGERPSAEMLAAENMSLRQATGTDYRGLIAAGDALAPNGTIVIFHGNGGTALDRGFYIEPLVALGFRVVLAEYPQYGGRPGHVGEKPFVADGLETVRRAFEKYGEPLYLLGESLGCGVAAAVAKQTSVPLAGIILITPWDTLGCGVARSLFPFLPVTMLLTDKYDSIGNLQSFKDQDFGAGKSFDLFCLFFGQCHRSSGFFVIISIHHDFSDTCQAYKYGINPHPRCLRHRFQTDYPCP